MSVGFPGGANTYVFGHELSGHLMIEYGRDVQKTAVNRVCRVQPVKNKIGTYIHFNPLDPARVRRPGVASKWAPGTLRPTSFGQTAGFEEKTFRTQRYAHGITLDKQGVDLANWPIQKMQTGILAQRAMTERAWRVGQVLFDTTKYASGHSATATVASGSGFLSGGTTGDPRIKNALDYGARKIQRSTAGAIRTGMLTAVMNSTTAQRLASTRELREYLMQNATAREEVTMRRSPMNAAYGLPSVLYDYNVVVNDLFFNQDNPGATGEENDPVFPDNKIALVVADGDVELPEGGEKAPSFNTCHVFALEEMTVEAFEDNRNRLIDLSVVMEDDVQIVSAVSGFVITNVFE